MLRAVSRSAFSTASEAGACEVGITTATAATMSFEASETGAATDDSPSTASSVSDALPRSAIAGSSSISLAMSVIVSPVRLGSGRSKTVRWKPRSCASSTFPIAEA